MNNIKTDTKALHVGFALKERRTDLHMTEVNSLPDHEDYGYSLLYANMGIQDIGIKKNAQPKPVVMWETVFYVHIYKQVAVCLESQKREGRE